MSCSNDLAIDGRGKLSSKIAKAFVGLAALVYGMILLYVLFFRGTGLTQLWTYTEYLKEMHNFIPFLSVIVFLTSPVFTEWVITTFVSNFVGNIILFIPWGILLPAYHKNAVLSSILRS